MKTKDKIVEDLHLIAEIREVAKKVMVVTIPKKYQKFGLRKGQDWHIILKRCINDPIPEESETVKSPPHESFGIDPSIKHTDDETAEFYDRYKEDKEKYYV